MVLVELVEKKDGNRYSRAINFIVNGVSVEWTIFGSGVDSLEVSKNGKSVNISVYAGYVNNIILMLNVLGNEFFEILERISKLSYQSQLKWSGKIAKFRSLEKFLKKFSVSEKISKKRKEIEKEFDELRYVFEDMKGKRLYTDVKYTRTNDGFLIWWANANRFYLVNDEKIMRITKGNVVKLLKGEKYRTKEIDEKGLEDFKIMLSELVDYELEKLCEESKIIAKLRVLIEIE